jgi:hypothetical protein
MILDPANVASKLLLNSIGSAVKRHLRFMSSMRSLEYDPLGHRSQNVASEIVMRAPAEGDIGTDGAREIFFGDFRNSLGGMLAQCLTRVDLMARNPNVHYRQAPSVKGTPLESGAG